eukprot:347639_1
MTSFNSATDEHTISLINGYVHLMEKDNNLSNTIPSSIIELFISFYHSPECFDKENCTWDIIIKGVDSDTIFKKGNHGSSGTAYGMNWIESNTSKIIKWTFKIMTGGYNIAIGIVSNHAVDIYDTVLFCNPDCYPCYFIQSQRMFDKGNIPSIWSNGKRIMSYGLFINEADTIITMELNLKNSKLIYYVNGSCCGVAVNNIKKDSRIKYQLGMHIREGMEVKLINCEIK